MLRQFWQLRIAVNPACCHCPESCEYLASPDTDGFSNLTSHSILHRFYILKKSPYYRQNLEKRKLRGLLAHIPVEWNNGKSDHSVKHIWLLIKVEVEGINWHQMISDVQRQSCWETLRKNPRFEGLVYLTGKDKILH